MAAELQVFADSVGIESRQVFLTNVSGAAIAGAELLEGSVWTGGFAQADTYTIELEFTHSIWQGTVTPATGYPATFEITGSGDSSAGGIIAGVYLAFGTLTPGITYLSVVEVGWHAGTLVAGATGAATQLWAKNVGDAPGTDARLLIRPDASVTHEGEALMVKAVLEQSLELTTPIGAWTIVHVESTMYDFELTFNGESAGTVSGIVDGLNLTVDLPDGPTLIIDLLNVDQGPATITISPGFQDFQLAPDEASPPGTFIGTELVLGAMDIGESVPFWIRAQSAPGRTAEGNPYTAQLQARIVSV